MKRVLLAAGVVVLLSGCGAAYDEEAHRADTADAIGVDELGDDQWASAVEAAEGTCEADESVFALNIGLALDSDDPEGHLGLIRTGVEHMCPERTGELEDVLAGLE